MPQKHTLKEYAADSYYHVYTRGVNKGNIFFESADKDYFLSLFERYLDKQAKTNHNGVPYPHYRNQINLLSYCLMQNHIHILLYQTDEPQAIQKFMSSLHTSYSKYLNLKYKRVGSVFESRYKAKRIYNEAYLMHISRYIHMNPRHWERYKHSSLRYFMRTNRPAWFQPEIIEQLFKNRVEYIDFLRQYQQNKDLLDEIKHELANYK